MADALDALGVPLGPPLRIASEDLVAAICLRCREPVLVLNSATPPLPFDLKPGDDGQNSLFVHGCFYDDVEEDHPDGPLISEDRRIGRLDVELEDDDGGTP